MSEERGEGVESAKEGIERYRETAKWLIGLLGSLAALLITSLSLSDLGKARNAEAASAGFVRALIGLAVALAAVTTVLAATKPRFPDIVSKQRFRDLFPDNSPELLGFDSLDALNRRFLASGRAYVAHWIEYDTAKAAGDVSATATALARARQTEHALALINPAVVWVKDYTFYRRVRAWFLAAMLGLTISVGLTANGVLAFARNVAPPQEDKSTAAVVATGLAVPGRIETTDVDLAAELSDLLGLSCASGGTGTLPYSVSALLMSMDGDEMIVAVEQTDQCAGKVLQIDPTLVRFHVP